MQCLASQPASHAVLSLCISRRPERGIVPVACCTLVVDEERLSLLACKWVTDQNLDSQEQLQGMRSLTAA